MIKLLADENFPLASVDILAINNFDVLSINKSHLTYTGLSTF